MDKHTNTARVCGVHDAFTRKHFCSYVGLDGTWCDDLEDEWARLENIALPAARRLTDGGRDNADRSEMKILAAIHYVRTDTFVKMHERIALEVVADYRARISSDVRAAEAFEADVGRPPRPGELEDRVDRAAFAFTEGRRMLLQQMVEGYNKTVGILSPHHVQLVWPRAGRSEFVFGDQALVHSDKAGRVSALGGLALGDADQIFLPLGPRLLALFSSRPLPDGPIPASMVQELNEKTWRAAVRFVGASPHIDLKRSLQRWDLNVPHQDHV